MERTLNVAATAVSSVCESATRLGQISALQTQSLESQSLIANELPAQLSASAVALEDAANILSGDADSGVEGTTHDLELLHTANELARQFSRLKHSGDCFLQQLLQTP
jgi:hypothetical protein